MRPNSSRGNNQWHGHTWSKQVAVLHMWHATHPEPRKFLGLRMVGSAAVDSAMSATFLCSAREGHTRSRANADGPCRTRRQHSCLTNSSKGSPVYVSTTRSIYITLLTTHLEVHALQLQVRLFGNTTQDAINCTDGGVTRQRPAPAVTAITRDYLESFPSALETDELTRNTAGMQLHSGPLNYTGSKCGSSVH